MERKNVTQAPVLKCCPFCGETPDMYYYDTVQGTTTYYVECVNSKCTIRPATVFYSTKKLAAEKWNTRARRDDTHVEKPDAPVIGAMAAMFERSREK